jgi:monoamine oxidase
LHNSRPAVTGSQYSAPVADEAYIELSEEAARALAAADARASAAGPGAPRIAIVGAGIAGLTAAFILAGRGVACTVYEAAERVGGRMHTGPAGYWEDGQTSEWCGELVDTGHLAIRALAKRFGLELIDMHAAEPEGTTETFHFGGGHYSGAEAAADFTAVRGRLAEDLEAAGEMDWSGDAAAGLELDAMSVADWIDSRVPGGRGSRLGALLDAGYRAECAADTADQSALNIVYALGAQPDAEGFALLGESDERFRVAGGVAQIPEAIAAGLPAPVELGHRLEAVAARSDGSVELVLDAAGARREVVADHVLLALPFAVLRTVDCEKARFDARKRAAIDELGAGSSAKVTLQFRERHWNAHGGTGTAATGGCATTWEATRGQPGATGILVAYEGGTEAAALAAGAPFADARDDAGVAESARTILDRLEPVFPGIAERWNGRAAVSAPMLDPLKRCSYPYYRVGQYHRFGGNEGVRSGNIHFAGDHCSELQGFMEGAATEGYRAAREILAAIGAG